MLSFVLSKVAVLSSVVHLWRVDEKKRFADRMMGRKVGRFRVKVAHFEKKPVCFSRKGVADFGDCGSRDRTAKGGVPVLRPRARTHQAIFRFLPSPLHLTRASSCQSVSKR